MTLRTIAPQTSRRPVLLTAVLCCLCLSEDGDTSVIQARPGFRPLGKNSLGEVCMATPAIIRDGLIIRTESNVLRIQ